jgi:hypothetical protein
MSKKVLKKFNMDKAYPLITLMGFYDLEKICLSIQAETRGRKGIGK